MTRLRPSTIYPAVSRLSKLIALLLLTLWLPATLHCALESADLVFASSVCTDGSNDHCAGDNCAQVEDGLFKQQTDDLQVVAPDLAACVCFLCLQLPSPAAPDVLVPRSAERPQDWVTTWHFVRRAAPAPRAPSLA